MTTKEQNEIDALDLDGLNKRIFRIEEKLLVMTESQLEAIFPEVLYLRYKVQRMSLMAPSQPSQS